MPNSEACLTELIVVAAGVGQADDLGLRGLRLQQEGREVLRVQRWRTLPSTLPPFLITAASVSRSSAWPNA